MKNILKYIILGIVLLVIQLFLAEFVNVLPVVLLSAVPVFIIVLPFNLSFTLLSIIAFSYGLMVDIFTEGIIGINASVLLTLSALRKPVIQLFVQKNYIENSAYIMSREISFSKIFYINITFCALFFFAYIFIDSIGHNNLLFNTMRFIIGFIINVVFWLFLEYILVKQILK